MGPNFKCSYKMYIAMSIRSSTYVPGISVLLFFLSAGFTDYRYAN